MKKPLKPRPLTKLEVNMEFQRIAKLHADGKIKQAWTAANDLWERDQKDPVANFAIALLIKEHGQPVEALRFARKAVEGSPNNAGYNVFLGKLNMDLGLFEDAPPFLERASQLDPKMYQAPWTLAEFYMSIGKGARALAYFDRAIAVAPEPALLQIKGERAGCLAAIGRNEEAKIEFESFEKSGQEKVYSLTRLALLSKNDHHSEFAGKIAHRLALPETTDEERSDLLLCLGRLFENGKNYDEAFENYTASRQLKGPHYEVKKFEEEVDGMIETYTSDFFKTFAGYGNPTTKPMFVVGMPRSGTTMTEQIIAGHSKVAGVGELNRMGTMRRNFSLPMNSKSLNENLTIAGALKWKDIPKKYLDLVRLFAPDAQHTVDKMPHNFISVGFIKLCFPNAKIVHCKRNPLDTFISAFQNQMNSSHGYSYNQVHYGEYYLQYLRLMEHWKKVLPGEVYDSTYEALTANPVVEVKQLLNFLDLPFEEACLDLRDRDSTVKTFSRDQVRNEINTNSISRWKRYEKHLGPIREVFTKAGIEI
jgi:tetratricopeptide (TPR) repeat protein